MKSTPIRNPEKDILLAPGNAALILIDYQPPQVSSIESIDRRTLINNVVALAKTARLYDLPIILSTVNVSNGVNDIYKAVDAPKAFPIHGYAEQKSCTVSCCIKVALEKALAKTQRAMEAGLAEISLAQIVSDVKKK